MFGDSGKKDRETYHENILHTIIEAGQADVFILSLCDTIKRLIVDKLHIVGDIFDRGARPDIVLDDLMMHHGVDIQWGNHDILWMGAASGSMACIAAALNNAFSYGNLDTIEVGYGISLRDLSLFAKDVYGGGFTANGGTVVINGGSVKATGGEGADDLGNGFNCKTAFAGIHNDEGNSVSILTVPLKEFALVCQNGIDKSSITAGHPDDENLYFYSDSNRNIATVYMKDGTVKFINYNRAEFSETNPFINGDERFSKYLITSDKDNASVIDGFSIESENENCRLIFNGSCVDKFKIIARGDVNLDGKLDGMDAVEAACVAGGMNNDVLAVKLADANFDGVVDNEDILTLENLGITTKEPLN